MKIKVRFFASMRDRMGRDEDSVVVEDGATVADVWGQVAAGQPLSDSTLIAVNMEYTDASAALNDGDELAFFPPVTGG